MIVWDLIYFWDVCPYTHEELRKRNRKRELAYWRQVAMYVARRSGMSHEQSAGLFGFDHSTCIYAIKCVDNALEGYNHVQGAMIQAYIDRAPRMADVQNIESTTDACVNEAICLTIMEGLVCK